MAVFKPENATKIRLDLHAQKRRRGLNYRPIFGARGTTNKHGNPPKLRYLARVQSFGVKFTRKKTFFNPKMEQKDDLRGI